MANTLLGSYFYKKSTVARWVTVLFLCLLFNAQIATAKNQQSIQQVAESGAPSLAMFMLDKQQKHLKQNSKNYLILEQQRHKIIIKWQLWQQGLKRIEALPNPIKPKFTVWANTLNVVYLIELKKYNAALAKLRTLIWSENNHNKKQLALWQKLIIRTYLESNQINNAEKAMLRYQQDYKDQSLKWMVLQAEILIFSGRADEVIDLLSGRYDEQFVLFNLLAKLKTQSLSNNNIYAKAIEKANEEHIAIETKAKYWLIAAQAAANSGSTVRQALNLNKVARLNIKLNQRLFPFSGDALWQAYLKNGLYIGNKDRLLLGDDERWFKEVELALPNYQIKAKSLLTVVAFKSQNANNQKRAYNRLIELILNNEQGLNVLKTLFVNTKRFEDSTTIPHKARYILVDDALANNNIFDASKLISQLSQPEGENQFNWEIRRARILIMGAHYQEGITILENLINSSSVVQSKQFDKITHVLFDLQSVEKYHESNQLFDLFLKRDISVKRKREILFWQADAYVELLKYKQAALLYFQSAYLINNYGSDPWGKTARYNAAEALANAGLIDDAERTYSKLLQETSNAKRRSVIQSQLQGLWLKLKSH